MLPSVWLGRASSLLSAAVCIYDLGEKIVKKLVHFAKQAKGRQSHKVSAACLPLHKSALVCEEAGRRSLHARGENIKDQRCCLEVHSPSVQEAKGVHVKATAAWKRDEKERRVG